jgi:serine/threonine-protein kinase RsbT
MTTITTDNERELAKLSVAKIQDVLLARVVVREEAARLGFSAQALTQIATAISEMTRNVVQHAGVAGQVRIFEIGAGGRRGLAIAVEDAGKGIADVERALSGASPGAGIPGCRKLMDEFTIRSDGSSGTAIRMVKWLPDS